jgi:hypothetical protein
VARNHGGEPEKDYQQNWQADADHQGDVFFYDVTFGHIAPATFARLVEVRMGSCLKQNMSFIWFRYKPVATETVKGPRMPSPYQGPHVLRLESGLKNPETVKTVSFRNDLAGSIEAVDLNLSHVLDLSEPEDLTWNRTSAIFLYPLARQPGQSFC